MDGEQYSIDLFRNIYLLQVGSAKIRSLEGREMGRAENAGGLIGDMKELIRQDEDQITQVESSELLPLIHRVD